MFGFVPKSVTYVPTKSQVSGLFFFFRHQALSPRGGRFCTWVGAPGPPGRFAGRFAGADDGILWDFHEGLAEFACQELVPNVEMVSHKGRW